MIRRAPPTCFDNRSARSVIITITLPPTGTTLPCEVLEASRRIRPTQAHRELSIESQHGSIASVLTPRS